MKTLVLDTNFLMIPPQFGVRLFDEFDRILDESYEAVTLRCVIGELEKLSERKGGKISKKAGHAEAALKLVKLKNIGVHRVESESCDSAILSFAESCKGVVCTLDKNLKKRARDSGLRTITLRQKSYLALGE